MVIGSSPSPEHLFASNRAKGRLHGVFGRAGARTEIRQVFETGGYRLRMPRSRGPSCEAVMVNTGGGMAGGDHARFTFAVEPDASVTLTTTAAEKIYGIPMALDAAVGTRIDVGLTVAAGASLEWLPQETILFDRAQLDRQLSATLEPGGRLLMAEMLVFGRLAMGETMRDGLLRDRWRIRRGGRLVLAEELALKGRPDELLDRPALGGGARASATVVLVSPEAEQAIDASRLALTSTDVTAGASAWNGLLVARATSPSPERLRAAIVALLASLRGRALPRLWS